MIAYPKKLRYEINRLDENKLYKLEEYKFKRNNEQNKKYWKLISELSQTLGISTEKLHRDMLKDYSVRYQVMVPNKTKLRGVEYYEKKSTIKNQKGELFDVYHVYTPSHELNTKEFASLLRGLIEECDYVGIDTVSPQEKKEIEAIAYGSLH